MSWRKHIKALLLLFVTLFQMSDLIAKDLNQLYDSANHYYANKQYELAITKYSQIISAGSYSSEVYYNLGNAYYKTNSIGRSILNYEKALRLSPSDEDILNNLKLANKRVEDRMMAEGGGLFKKWTNGIGSSNLWAWFSIILSFVACFLLVFYFVVNRLITKKVFFYSAIVSLLFALFSFLIAKSKYDLYLNTHEGIVMVGSVTARSSPNKKGTSLFILHEGTKVNIQDSNEAWVKLELPDGTVGWVEADKIEKI